VAKSHGRCPQVRPCPQCQGEAVASTVAIVGQSQILTFRCRRCGHVWEVTARHSKGPVIWHDD
jgi:uncharacterized Zn finger protein